MGGSSRSSVQSKGTSKQTKAKNAAARGGKQLTGSCHKLSSESYALQFPGALPVKQVVYGLYCPNQWRQATIVHCREGRRGVQGDGAGGMTAEGGVKQSAEPKSYDYYVHWLRMDRRLDTWLRWDEILALNEPLPEGDEVVLPHGIPSDDDDHAGMDEEYLREHEEMTKVKTIRSVVMGHHCVDAWYYSPYPKEYQNIDKLYICEFCLSFFRHLCELTFHISGCNLRHPPGNELYRDEKNALAMWEIDGALCRVYCENLCYLSKLFLDHKTLKHPVNLFLFYVLTEVRPSGFYIVGYFSKEKYSRNNLSCILTLPQHQRKGYGKFLINFSYALSQREMKRGTPERPLSDLGKASYICFWTARILDVLKPLSSATVEELADRSYVEPNDIAMCLQTHKVLQRHPKSTSPFIFLPEEVSDHLTKKSGKPPPPIVDEDLRWQPYDSFLAPFEYNPNC